MIAVLLSLFLWAGQAAPAPAAKPPLTKPPVEAPAAKPATPAAPVAPAAPAAPAAPVVASARLEAQLAGMKGQQQAAFTSKLGPAESIRQAVDGQVLFWSVTLQGQTVCGAGADGQLVCGRQGAGTCGIAAAFKTEGGMSNYRASGMPAACEAAADLFQPPAKPTQAPVPVPGPAQIPTPPPAPSPTPKPGG